MPPFLLLPPLVPAEYYVAEATALAICRCREADGTTPLDSLLFALSCLDDYTSAGGPYDESGLGVCHASCMGICVCGGADWQAGTA